MADTIDGERVSRTEERGLSCPLCGSEDYRRVALRKGTAIFRCARCGLTTGMDVAALAGASTVVPTDPAHFQLLIDEYPQHKAVTRQLLEARWPVYEHILGGPPRTWLEIGPANGALSEILAERQCRWIGVEFDAAMAERMIADGKNVVHADFSAIDAATLQSEFDQANGGFDIVSFSQVLEHVALPDRFLANAFASLRPGGLVHVDVPNDGGLTAKLRRGNPFAGGYGEIVPPHHMIAYSKPTLRAALEAAGFEIVRLFDCPYDDPVFGLVHARMSSSKKLKAVWKLSSAVGGGGNLVALARRPA